MKDESGQTVVTKLDETMLRQIAASANGIFVRASNNEDVLKNISKEINTMEKKKFGEKEYSEYEDRFQIFFAAAFVLLLVEFLLSERRNKWIKRMNIFGDNK
jgi:Ca-activated chloride channel family protein